MRTLFVDECKAGKYLLTVVSVETAEIPSIRKSISSLRMKGQSRIHFVDEGNTRRRRILNHLRSLNVGVPFYESSLDDELLDRQSCLRALVADLNQEQDYQIWLEQEENHLKSDRSTLAQELKLRGMTGRVEYMHADPKQQTLLWIPDALGWVQNRGGVWRKELLGFSVKTIRL